MKLELQLTGDQAAWLEEFAADKDAIAAIEKEMAVIDEEINTLTAKRKKLAGSRMDVREKYTAFSPQVGIDEILAAYREQRGN